jgi:hypothetical protein
MYFLPFFMFAAALAECRADEVLFFKPLVFPCTMVVRKGLVDGTGLSKRKPNSTLLVDQIILPRGLVGVRFPPSTEPS